MITLQYIIKAGNLRSTFLKPVACQPAPDQPDRGMPGNWLFYYRKSKVCQGQIQVQECKLVFSLYKNYLSVE